MGCSSSQKAVVEPMNLKAMSAPKGVLTLDVQDAILERDAAIMLKMDPYVELRLYHTRQLTKVIKNGDKTPIFNEQFTWFINSDKIYENRRLEITVWDKNTGADTEVGYGIADLDPVIYNKLQGHQLKCYLMYNRKPAGFVNVKLSFKDEFKGMLLLRPMTASIRRRTSTLSDMKCVVRVTIGEAVEETHISKDSKENPPFWKDLFRMSIIGSSMMGKLEVLDMGIGGETVVGDAEVNIGELMTDPLGKQQNIEIRHKDAVAGNVRFIAAYVPLDTVGVQNRQRMVEENERELILKENQLIEKQKQMLRKKKQAQEKLKQEQREKEERQKREKEEAQRKQKQQRERKEKEDKEKKDAEASKGELPAPKPAQQPKK